MDGQAGDDRVHGGKGDDVPKGRDGSDILEGDRVVLAVEKIHPTVQAGWIEISDEGP